jgi:hypothetical protein
LVISDSGHVSPNGESMFEGWEVDEHPFDEIAAEIIHNNKEETREDERPTASAPAEQQQQELEKKKRPRVVTFNLDMNEVRTFSTHDAPASIKPVLKRKREKTWDLVFLENLLNLEVSVKVAENSLERLLARMQARLNDIL